MTEGPGPTPASSEPAAAGASASGPLAGIQVLDLTTFLSGPYCTQILADLGANVVKVEPFGGDLSRSIPPHFIGTDSAYYMGNNRGKQSIVIDLKAEAGLRIALDLISRADIVVENFRPGVCARLGLDVDEIRSSHPGLIWASISGFGQTGPWRDKPAYDMIVQALSGVMSLTGEPNGPPVRLGIPAGDLVAGMFAVIGVLAALADRQRGAQGRLVDISMLDGQLSMLSYQAVYSMITRTSPGPQGSRHDSIPTYRSFTGGDGRELVVTANTERMWGDMCTVLGIPELAADPRFADGGKRHRNRDVLWPYLESAFAAAPAEKWVARLNERGVPAALIKTVTEALEDAEESGRGMVVTLSEDDGRTVRVIGNPIKFAGEPPVATRFPPTLGRDTAQVLRERLSMSEDTIAELLRDGVVKASQSEP
jgi:CoA:oxalate CoA-transferase